MSAPADAANEAANTTAATATAARASLGARLGRSFLEVIDFPLIEIPPCPQAPTTAVSALREERRDPNSVPTPPIAVAARSSEGRLVGLRLLRHPAQRLLQPLEAFRPPCFVERVAFLRRELALGHANRRRLIQTAT
jgi:hypothetical protein